VGIVPRPLPTLRSVASFNVTRQGIVTLSQFSASIESATVHVGCGGWVSADTHKCLGCEDCLRLLSEDETVTVYPCSSCGWTNACGDPPGEDWHS
jgi:hypothetical protein